LAGAGAVAAGGVERRPIRPRASAAGLPSFARMRYGIPACLAIVAANVALFFVYNKADSEWPAIAMGLLTLVAIVVGVTTVVGERFRGAARDLGWGLLGGSAGSVLLAVALYVWIIDRMS